MTDLTSTVHEILREKKQDISQQRMTHGEAGNVNEFLKEAYRIVCSPFDHFMVLIKANVQSDTDEDILRIRIFNRFCIIFSLFAIHTSPSPAAAVVAVKEISKITDQQQQQQQQQHVLQPVQDHF